MDELDADLARDLEDPVVAIELAVGDAHDAGVGELLEAVPARARRDVVGGAVDVHAVARGLDDRVGLGVDGRDAVAVLHHVADVRAVRHAADRAVVAGRQDGPVADDHRADVLARAGRAGRDDLRDAHEIFVPRGAGVGFVGHGSSYTRRGPPGLVGTRGADGGGGIGYGRRSMSGQETKSKYKDTVILPETPFPMRGDLAKREPEILARWNEIKLYERICAARAGAPL